MLRSRKIRIAAYVTGGILGLLVFAVALLHTSPVRSLLLAKAVRILRDEGIGVSASRLDYNLLGPQVWLRDVKVQSLQTPDLPPLVTAEEMEASINLGKLLQGAYYVKAAAIVNPRVHLVIDEAGRDNIPHPPPKPAAPSKPLDYLVTLLRISGGAVQVEERRQHIDVLVPLEQLTVTGDAATRNHAVRLVTRAGGHVTLAARSLPLKGLAADLVMEKDSVQVQRITGALGESSLTVAGRVNRLDSPQFDLSASAELALASLVEFAGVPQTVRGKVNVTLAAKGPLSAIQASARVQGERLVVDRFEDIGLQAEAVYEAAASQVRLRSLAVSSPWANVRGEGTLALNVPVRESSAKFTVQDADLERLSPLLNLPVRIASRAGATVEARWPGLQFEAAAFDAALRVSSGAPSSGLAKDRLPVDATLRATGTTEHIAVDVNDIRALNTAVSGQVVLTNRKALSGDLRVEASRLAATIDQAETFLGKEHGTLAGTPIDGRLTSSVKLSGSVDAPAAEVRAAIPDLSSGELREIAVTMAANYTPERVSIGDASVVWRGQRLHASGSMGLSGASQTLDIQAGAERVSLAAILAGLNQGDLPLTGDLTLAADVKGTTAAPLATVQLNAGGLTAYQELLGNLQLAAKLDGAQVDLSELRLDKPQEGGNGLLNATGAYNLNTKQYRFAAHGQDLRVINLALPDGPVVHGSVLLDASGEGMAEDPVGQLKLVADRIVVGEQEYGRAEIALKGENQQLDVQAALPKFHLTASGKAGYYPPHPAAIEVRMDQTALSELPVKLDSAIVGTVSGVVNASGELENYKQGRGRAQISSLDLRYNGEPVRTDGPLVASYANGTLTVEKAAIVAADSRLEASGTLPLEAASGEGAIQLKAQLNLPRLAAFAPADQKLEMAGSASVEGTIRGTLQRLDPTLAIALDQGSFSMAGVSPAVTGASLRGQVRDGALELESASAKWGDATFQASGTVPFALLPANLGVELPRRQGPAKLTADLKGMNLATLGSLPETASGMVSVHVDAEAARPELEAVKATLTFPELQARFDTYAVAQNGTTEIGLENGVAAVRHFQLSGPSTEIQLSGTAEVSGKQALDLRLDGKLDASLAAAFATGLRARGPAEVHASVTGSAAKPDAKGYVQLADGQFSLDQPRLGIEGLNLRLDLDGSKAVLSKLEGQANGGTLSGKGSVGYAGGKLQDADLSVQADDLYIDFPAGLKTVSDVRLQLKSIEDRLLLRGSVVIKEGGFTDDLNFDKGILAAVTAPRSLDLTERRNAMLDSLRMNVSVVTQDPLVVQNNLAKAEITAQLVVLGSPYQPGLAGRLIIEDGSELTLQERKYEVSRGVITFTNERSIEPSLDVEATTTASNYDITLQISGPPGDTKTTLTSNPILPEPDILAILVTGKTLDEIRGQEFQVAQAQVLSYLTGRVGAQIGHQLEKATGLSRVRVEPNLIAAETNPGARLTVGQDITRQLQLVYSMDLVNSTDQIYIAEYDLTKRFVTRGVRQSDGSYRFDFRHDLRFGGISQEKTAKHEVRRIGLVTLTGEPYFAEEKILAKLKVKTGDRYDFFKLRKGIDRVTALYTKESLLESSVRLRRDQKAGTVNLNLKLDAGPKLNFVYEGASVPGGVRKNVRKVWSSGVFDTQRVEDATGVLRAWMIGQKRLAPQVTPEVTTPAEDQKRVVFDIQPGPKFENVEWVFDGAEGIRSKELRSIVEGQKLTTEVYTKPSRVTELLTQYYREMGFLDAVVKEPKYALNAETRTGKVVFPVKEGPQYKVGEPKFIGNTALTPAELADAAPLPRGEGYRPSLRENALQRLREAYWSHGYNEVEADVEEERIPERALVNLTFRVTENARGVVQDVTVEGNRATSESLIRSQLEIKPGDPVNLQKISNSRRKLYNTGAFAVVEINREDQPASSGETTKQVRLKVHVQEVQPFVLRYGGFYDTERGPGGIVDISNQNSLGSARQLGFRVRYDAQLQEARIYFSQPLLTRFRVKTIASPYVRREINPETDLTSGFNVDRVGVTLQQEVSLGRKMLLNYGYKIEKSRTYDTGPDPIFNVPLRLASLTSTFTRDTRDDILDASTGSFLSHAFQFSPESLGSQVRYVKYFGQYFRYIPLQKPRVELFTNKVLRPRLVYATAVRVGLARGLGDQEVPLSERFFAGGGTTIRGFAQNSVGPATFTGTELGGTGLFILNNEMRFPLISVFDGVGFVDVGNVWSKVSDFNPTDLRKAAGLGLRVRTPWFLLRMDYGFNLDRRMGEPTGRLFFSIGQAF